MPCWPTLSTSEENKPRGHQLPTIQGLPGKVALWERVCPTGEGGLQPGTPDPQRLMDSGAGHLCKGPQSLLRPHSSANSVKATWTRYQVWLWSRTLHVMDPEIGTHVILGDVQI